MNAGTCRSLLPQTLLSVAALVWLAGASMPAAVAQDRVIDQPDKQALPVPDLLSLEVASTLDDSPQPSLYWAPESASEKPTPLLVYLHSWSGDYRQKNSAWLGEAAKRGWIYLHPNFRGPNNTPAACGSKLARQDILDAIDRVVDRFKVDPSRIYLAGSSGGGHMSMLMAGHHPQRFSAVSAWVGISDLAEWYRFHTKDGVPQQYAKMIVASCGGPPGASPEVDAEYRDRSPLFHLQNARDLPLDLNAGVNDGHTGSVPIFHTLRAYNVVARAGQQQVISDYEMQTLWKQGKLTGPQPGDTTVDPSYGRKILLRRTAGKARVTIFDGGHEGLSHPGCAWLATQRRATRKVGSKVNTTPVKTPVAAE